MTSTNRNGKGPWRPVDGETPAEGDARRAKGKHRGFYEAEARRAKMLELIAAGMPVEKACGEVGVRVDTYRVWRQRFPRFAANLDAVRIAAKGIATTQGPSKKGLRFAERRQLYFGHVSAPFQIELADAIERCRPGNVILVLLPPEHGKTTTFEDIFCLRVGDDPSIRCHVGSESQGLSRKILARIQTRMNPSVSKFPTWLTQFGPFMPPKAGSEDRHSQPWTATHFDVFRKASHDERDYTMAALGFGSQIIGSRSDWLHCDDLQSRNTLNQTMELAETWVQDWLSRPGEDGITTVFGNRVDEGDIYEAIEEALPADICRVIRYPAILDEGTPEARPLWPEKWTMEKLDRQRRKLEKFPGVWERNWMQRPIPKGSVRFPKALTLTAADPNLAWGVVVPGEQHWISLDPALDGISCQGTFAVKDRMRLVRYRRDVKTWSNEDLIRRLEEEVEYVCGNGGRVTDVIIEAKNFQKGLARHEMLEALTDKWGFGIREHDTGVNKYDENIGVASMTTTFRLGELVLPYGPDARADTDAIAAEFEKWRPYRRGNQLRQDIVMMVWFAWIKWQEIHKEIDDADSAQWQTVGLGSHQTRTGLIVPREYAGRILTA